jgi:putative acetyltransferase
MRRALLSSEKESDMHIRDERPEDAAIIEAITTDAFRDALHAGGNEGRIPAALRAAGALSISLVAVDDSEQVIGHIAFSPVEIDRQTGGWFALGPVSVRPDLHRRGIGSALIRDGLERLEALGAAGCLLMGEPAYYARFGFVTGDALTYFRHPNPYLQWLVLEGPMATGDVIFHPAFEVE